MTDHTIHPRPVQHPHSPILSEAMARLLTLAATEADIVGLTGITFRRGGPQPDLLAWRATIVEAAEAVL